MKYIKHSLSKFENDYKALSRMVFFEKPESHPIQEGGDDEDLIIFDDDGNVERVEYADGNELILTDEPEGNTDKTKQEGEKTWENFWNSMKPLVTKSKLRQTVDKDLLGVAQQTVLTEFTYAMTYEEMDAFGEKLVNTPYKNQPKVLVNTIGSIEDIPNNRLVELVQLMMNDELGIILGTDNKFGPKSKEGWDKLNRKLHPQAAVA